MHIKIYNFFKKNYLIIIIIVLAFVFRIYKISQVPPSLNWDEVSHAYNAYSILKTGRDEWGLKFPIIFRAYGDYKLPVYIYMTSLSELFLGLNSLAVRLPSVLAGVGSVLFTYLLIKELFEKSSIKFNVKLLAIISAALLAFEPWGLFLSRGAFEANLALFLIISGSYFTIKGFKDTRYLVFGSLLYGLSVWSYNSARIFTPLLILSIFLIYNKKLLALFKKNRRLLILVVLIIVIFFLPMFWQLLNPIGQARYGKVSIVDAGAVGKIIEMRQGSPLPRILTRVIYNRPTYFMVNFIKNWFSHFSFEYLFLKGGSNFQFSLPGHGLLTIINLPFVITGFLFLLIKALQKDKQSILLLSWIFLAPIPDSLTREAPHVLRSIVMLPTPMIISSIGLLVVWSYLKRSRLFLALYSLLFMIFTYSYFYNYFINYSIKYSWSWQYGYQQVFNYIKENSDKYDKIIITKKYGEPHEFMLFYMKWDPKKLQNESKLIRFNQSNWYWVDRIDKYFFINDWNIPRQEWQKFVLESGLEFNCDNQSCLLITSPGNVPKGWSKVETINFLDNIAAFEIYEN